MGEELKTDVGSADERDQATKRRQQEIQEATVRFWVGKEGHIQAIYMCSKTDQQNTDGPSVARTEPQAVDSELYIQYGGA